MSGDALPLGHFERKSREDISRGSNYWQVQVLSLVGRSSGPQLLGDHGLFLPRTQAPRERASGSVGLGSFVAAPVRPYWC